MLKNGERRVLVTYRIQKAKSVLKEAYDNAQLGHWTLVGNRLYYTVYHMAQALLLDKGFQVIIPSSNNVLFFCQTNK